jgi:hypothetical protein
MQIALVLVLAAVTLIVAVVIFAGRGTSSRHRGDGGDGGNGGDGHGGDHGGDGDGGDGGGNGD